MKIAPIDITHKSFERKMFGLDAEEVQEFLRSIADEYEKVIRERNQLRETLREKELSIIEYRERDEVLKNTITTATQMSEKIRKDSEREAGLIVQEASQKAEMILHETRESLRQHYEEIANLKRLRLQFETNLRSMFNTHLALLDQHDRYMPDFVGSHQSEIKGASSQQQQARSATRPTAPAAASRNTSGRQDISPVSSPSAGG